MNLEITPNEIIVMAIKTMTIKPAFQNTIIENNQITSNGNHFQTLDFGNGRAMILDLGQGQKSAYIYLEDDDDIFSKVKLTYSVDGGPNLMLEDAAYPFEFTIPIEKGSRISFFMEGKKIDGSNSHSRNIDLGP